MNKTPRTDNFFAQTVTMNNTDSLSGWLQLSTDLETELIEMRAEVERKDKIIEQMREALTKLIGTLEVMSVMPETLGKYPVLAIDAPELEQARTALAAERGE